MRNYQKIFFLFIAVLFTLLVGFGNSGCRVYSFKEGAIPDSIKSIKINFFENRARYVNPTLSPKLTDRLRQKLTSQTRLTQRNDNADWEITGYVSEYSLSTSAISGQRESGNRLTVSVNFTVSGLKKLVPKEYTVSRNFEFSANQSLQEAENNLMEEMLRSLTDDIFNRLFSEW